MIIRVALQRWLNLAPLLLALVTVGQARAASCDRPNRGCAFVERLLAQREGYGRRAVGGLNGEFALVTSDADSGPGSLRDTVKGAHGPLWVLFSRDMTITLRSKLLLPSDTTIDGRGHQVTLYDYGLDVRQSIHDVIVTHLKIDGRFRTEEVAFNFTGGARDIWADHLDLSRFIDRLINVKTGATDVTLSWIKFHDHNKVMLLNNLTDKNLFAYWNRDSNSHVTIHHCWFVDTVQRSPRAVLGVYDVYNNLLENWDFYGMSFGLEARAAVIGNIFINSPNRPCREPDHFDTIEHIEKNYCSNISKAYKSSALPNGKADEAEYEQSNALFHYTHDYRAFLTVSDNLFVGSQPVLSTFDPDRVDPMPYCNSYARPTMELASRIRREAGDTVSEGDPPVHCPTDR
ncbi:MAG: hypothetical protein ABI056_07170 [Caulobacteraceae bacterium]